MGLSPTFGARRFPKGERKELWCARRRKPFFRPGLTRRLRRGRWGCRLMGFHQLRCLKVSKGRAESPLVRPLAHTSCRRRGGLTRRLRRGSRACSPMGRASFSFGGERKGCKRKPAARRLQRPPCPDAVGVGHTQPLWLGMLGRDWSMFATQKASVGLISRWPLLRAMRPVAEWRSLLYNLQGAAPDRRAVAPVVPRR